MWLGAVFSCQFGCFVVPLCVSMYGWTVFNAVYNWNHVSLSFSFLSILDINSPTDKAQTYELLANNYVEDNDFLFRFDYSTDFLT